MAVAKETQHSMQRRSAAHDYSLPGFYHITLHVAEGMGQLLGTVVGSDADKATVALTEVGKAVEHELLTAITAHYPMITVDTYIVMPEHLHFILVVRAAIVSSSGRKTHLGQVIAGFKKGCNHAFWAAIGEGGTCAVKPHSTVAEEGAKGATKTEGAKGTTKTEGATETEGAKGTAGASTVTGGYAARKERYSSGRATLFAPGYCDVMPIEAGQLTTMRNYIKDNARSRWLRTHHRERLQPRRDGIDTAVTPAALRGYLKRECPAHLVTPEVLAQIEGRLMIADAGAGDRITCHSYGERALLNRRLLPVVCHRKDKDRYEEQKARCLEAAAQGGVLVSPRIAKGEQGIIDEAVSRGYAVIAIADNGFPEVYHPSQERIDRCAEGRLLIITPWQYRYRGKNEAISVPACKTMNCIAQAICRLRDDWWKTMSIEEMQRP